MKQLLFLLAVASVILVACSKEGVTSAAAIAAAQQRLQHADSTSDSTIDTTHHTDSATVRVTLTSRNVSVSQQLFNYGETVTVWLATDSMHYGQQLRTTWRMQRTDSVNADTVGAYKLTVPSKNSSFAYLQILKKGTYKLTVRSFTRDSVGGVVPLQKGFANFSAN